MPFSLSEGQSGFVSWKALFLVCFDHCSHGSWQCLLVFLCVGECAEGLIIVVAATSHLILPESAAEGKDWKVDLETFESLASPLSFAFLTRCSQPGSSHLDSAHLRCLPPTSSPLTLSEHSALRRCRWIVQFIENCERSMGDCCGGCCNSCQAWLHGRKTPESLPP